MLDQLEKLTGLLHDGQLAEDDRRRLNELLANAGLRRHFVELNKLHYCLSCRSMPSDARAVAQATSEVHRRILDLASGLPYSKAILSESQNSPATSLRERHSKWAYMTARPMLVIAATLLVVSCISGLILKSFVSTELGNDIPTSAVAKVEVKTEEMPSNVLLTPASYEGFAARIVSISQDAVWNRDTGPSDFLMRLSVGDRLKLSHGIIKLEFATQAFAVLSAPADLEILGAGDVLLRKGKLTGRSEEGNFTVQTPSAYVVDIGTAFGVFVDDQDATDVVVFEGEVNVQRTSASKHTMLLTSGMSVRVDHLGLNQIDDNVEAPSFDREFNGKRPSSLGANELSLVDIICGSAPGEYRSAGSIDPETGTWSTLPWSESKGVRDKASNGKVVLVEWNPWVQSIFVPDPQSNQLVIDLGGQLIESPTFTGGAWGPIWARRKIGRQLDPLVDRLDRDVEGFWGAGTTTALLDRSRWVRDGIVGMHANVGVTIDLQAIRKGYSSSIQSFRGVLAHLEHSRDSLPFHPQARSTFQIHIDGELRYERQGFCRQDGDAMFGVELLDGDRLLTLLVTDSNDGPIYDRVILLDPVFEMSSN